MIKIFNDNQCLTLLSELNSEKIALSNDPNAVISYNVPLCNVYDLVKDYLKNSNIRDLVMICYENINDNVTSKVMYENSTLTENLYLKEIFRDYKELDAAGGIVSDDNGQILMINRMGHWDLPKGMREKGESLDVTAVREVKEECSLEIFKLGKLLTISHHIYEREGIRYLKHTYWYEMKADSSLELTPQIEEDITEVRWVNISDLPKYMTTVFGSIKQVLKDSFIIK